MFTPATRIRLAFGGLALAAIGGVALAEVALEAGWAAPSFLILGVGLPLAVLAGLAWAWLELGLVDKQAQLAAKLKATSAKGELPELEDESDALSATALDLARDLRRAADEGEAERAAALRLLEAEKQRLEQTLADVGIGLLICNLNHQLLLYNKEALVRLHVAGELGLGRSVFDLLNRRALTHTLERLTGRLSDGHPDHPDGLACRFVASSSDGSLIVQARMSLILDDEHRPNGYSLAFEDRTEELAELVRRDHLIGEATDGIRHPLANLRLAADLLVADLPEAEAQTAKLAAICRAEAETLSAHLERLSAEHQNVLTGHWPLTDMYSANLLEPVVRRLEERLRVAATITGLPCWLRGDSLSLAELLIHYGRCVVEETGVTALDLEARSGTERVYLTLRWQGEALSDTKLEAWQQREFDSEVAHVTVADVLDHHKSTVWSKALDGGQAELCLTVPLSPETDRLKRQLRSDQDTLPARPEFYDFDLLTSPLQGGLSGERLADLAFVVLDTETTGLRPSDGDEIVQIAGVRIVNGRVLTGESFSALVNPERPIPAASTRFHGITDAMVADRPPAGLVLKQFQAFVGDAVLVAHNAAFDMKFIKLKEAASGVTFDQPVLDTLLISAVLDPDVGNHTLDALASRLGVVVEGRHTALGDTLATAAIFLKMLERLEARGISRLDQLIKATDAQIALKRRQEDF